MQVNYSLNGTIEGGGGSDTISMDAANLVYIYNEGDGNDKIYGFDETSTLKIVDSSYSTQVSGSDIVVEA